MAYRTASEEKHSEIWQPCNTLCVLLRNKKTIRLAKPECAFLTPPCYPPLTSLPTIQVELFSTATELSHVLLAADIPEGTSIVCEILMLYECLYVRYYWGLDDVLA